MKTHSYTFNFKTSIYLIIYSFLLIIFLITISELFLKKFDKKYYNLFDKKSIDEDIILIGNSRTIKLQNYSKIKILNLSYNELTQDGVIFFLETIKNKTNYSNKKIYIEITSLQKGKVNCNFLIYRHLNYFNNEYYKSCEKDLLNTIITANLKFNSEIFQRILIEKILNRKKISELTISKEICNNSILNPYDKYYQKRKNLEETIKIINTINKKYKNVTFIITPFINGYQVSKKIENLLILNDIDIVQLTKILNKNFYDDCTNFWDKSHYNHQTAKKISNFLWKN